MNGQKWLAYNFRLDKKKKKTTEPLYLIQDSTITTAIDIRRGIVSVINILNPANIPLSHQHVRMHQPARQPF